jgi:hypothetical protein
MDWRGEDILKRRLCPKHSEGTGDQLRKNYGFLEGMVGHSLNGVEISNTFG